MKMRPDPIFSLAIAVLWASVVCSAAEPTITALAIAPGEELCLVGSQAGLALHKTASLEKVGSFTTALEQVSDLSFAPDGEHLLAVGGIPGELGSAELYSWPAMKLEKSFNLADDLIYRVAWSRDSSWFAAAGHDGKCIIKRVDGSSLASYAGHSRSVLAVTLLPGDQQLLSAGVDQTIQLWSSDGQRRRAMNNHTATVTDLAIHPASANGQLRLVSTSEDRSVRLWYPEIGRMVKFVRLDHIPRRVLWHSRERLVTASDDGTITLIDATEMQIVRSIRTDIRPIVELAATDDSLILAGANGMKVLRFAELLNTP